MTPKQQAIKKAYEDKYDTYKNVMDPDGWVNVHDAEPPKGMEIDTLLDMGSYWRPKSLNGLEDNRGWISVEERLPETINIACWVYTSIGAVRKDVWHGPEVGWSYVTTHWQPVVQPEPPIY